MEVAFLCSNQVAISEVTKKGTEIFDYSLITGLAKYAEKEAISLTAFCAGSSTLPVPIESVADLPSVADEILMAHGQHVIFELALLSKAFTMQDRFDLYHMNIGDGDLAVPFAPFVSKPILITLHHIVDADYTRNYFSLFKEQKHVFFISASNSQRKLLPDLPYIDTIYHGVDTEKFSFNPKGGEEIMWAGRAIPEKGPDIVITIAEELHKKAKLFGIPRREHQEWFERNVLAKINTADNVSFQTGKDRFQLIPEFQTSKVFLFPVSYEESFGLVLIEALSCGTPVIAFARGSIPEIIKDGVTGFIVNESEEDRRGDWVIKKSGVEGLKEAVNKLYSLPEQEYQTMRRACREHVEQYFSLNTMVENYIRVYKEVVSK